MKQFTSTHFYALKCCRYICLVLIIHVIYLPKNTFTTSQFSSSQLSWLQALIHITNQCTVPRNFGLLRYSAQTLDRNLMLARQKRISKMHNNPTCEKCSNVSKSVKGKAAFKLKMKKNQHTSTNTLVTYRCKIKMDDSVKGILRSGNSPIQLPPSFSSSTHQQ